MSVSIALFTSNLRLHDNPVLHGALASADRIVPLFVVDDGVHAAGFGVPNRTAFLNDCLADLDAGLRARGGALVVRSGDLPFEAGRVAERTGAVEVHIAAGVSAFAQRREDRLRQVLRESRRSLHSHDAVVTAVAPGELTPGGKDHFAVFTPYFRRWSTAALRAPLAAPRVVPVADVPVGRLPTGTAPARGETAPDLPAGGESVARRLFAEWLEGPVEAYAEAHDDLPGDATSRLSPYLHFGCVSAGELVRRLREHGGPGAAAFERQLAWRDFHHQVLAARPDASWRDYRPRGDRWRVAPEEIEAWRHGRTGYPVVDAAMRQLVREGWMHNRARLLAASFLTKTLYVDWRTGARHFLDLLVDGDIPDNQMNWQWVAGTGTDTRPNRVLNPLAQARRFDPDGAYVRRYVPELADVAGPAVHRPWLLPAAQRSALGYPDPVVDLDEAAARFRLARGVT